MSKNLTPEQVTLIQRAKDSLQARRNAANSLEDRVREYRETLISELEPLEARWGMDVYALVKSGLSKPFIAREVLGQKGTVAIYKAYEKGAMYAGAVAPVEGFAKFNDMLTREEDGAFVFTPPAEELAKVVATLGIQPDAAPTSGRFVVERGRVATAADQAAFLPSGEMDPVVAMVMADGSRWAAQILDASK